MSNSSVHIELTADEGLVLFEFLARFREREVLSIEDQAEERALWNLAALLERELVEPFSESYLQLISQARERLHDKET